MTELEALRRALEPPFGDEIRVIVIPTAAGHAERLVDGDAGEPAFFWSSGDGGRLAGVGEAARLQASGPDRAAALVREAERLWSRVRTGSAAGDDREARLFGGLSFLPAPPPAPWAGFGEATLVLPEVTYRDDGAGPRLVVAAVAAAVRAGPDALLDRVARAVRALATTPVRSGSGVALAPPGPVNPPGERAVSEWAAAVASIRERIERGEAEKVVAARVHEARFTGAMVPSEVLARLAVESGVTRFAIRFEGATFLGATPERLVSRRGNVVESEALAGTCPASEGASRLLESGKDRAEHGYVVRAIDVALRPLCRRLDSPPEPGVRRLSHVLHLHTPFRGELARPVAILDLVDRLHPTPAVGGTPTAAALDWIASAEGGTRGWYAAPVGWLDASGDGEFVVALRSALLDGDRARLYAGAGIVQDSEAAAEFAETRAKLQTMMDALGVSS
jgi:isochorismate synthase